MPDLTDSVRDLFSVLPLQSAMADLVPKFPNAGYLEVAERAASSMAASLPIQAAIWIYVDDLSRSHEISQDIPGPIGAYWHGIMHRREGEFANSRYWLRQVGTLPFELEDYQPSRFVDEVQAVNGANPEQLVVMQRLEWKRLFDYCVAREL